MAGRRTDGSGSPSASPRGGGNRHPRCACRCAVCDRGSFELFAEDERPVGTLVIEQSMWGSLSLLPEVGRRGRRPRSHLARSDESKGHDRSRDRRASAAVPERRVTNRCARYARQRELADKSRTRSLRRRDGHLSIPPLTCAFALILACRRGVCSLADTHRAELKALVSGSARCAPGSTPRPHPRRCHRRRCPASTPGRRRPRRRA